MVTKLRSAVGSHPVLSGLGVLLIVCAGVGTLVWNQTFGLPQSVVYFGVPDAPTLTAQPNETLYRIDAFTSISSAYLRLPIKSAISMPRPDKKVCFKQSKSSQIGSSNRPPLLNAGPLTG